MTYRVPDMFGRSWRSTPMVKIDFETTGLPPIGRAVEVGFARFEDGKCVESYGSLINPGCPIPAEATAIHGITDEDVKDAPTVEQVFEEQRVRTMLHDAQPGAYNASFDRLYVPMTATIEHSWPWLDTMVIARHVDRYVSGKNKHKLVPTCERHGVALPRAHRAEDDAKASGELFHVLIEKLPWVAGMMLGELLHWMREEQNREWLRFNKWLYEKQAQESP
jgi:DNA polymerase III alpha subunit (gram-positive type)